MSDKVQSLFKRIEMKIQEFSTIKIDFNQIENIMNN